MLTPSLSAMKLLPVATHTGIRRATSVFAIPEHGWTTFFAMPLCRKLICRLPYSPVLSGDVRSFALLAPEAAAPSKDANLGACGLLGAARSRVSRGLANTLSLCSPYALPVLKQSQRRLGTRPRFLVPGIMRPLLAQHR